MRSLITGEDVFNQLMMLRTSYKGAFLILEGTSDCSVMDNFIQTTSCQTIPGLTKVNVLDTVALAGKRGISGVLGIVDADFDHLHGAASTPSNICLTDLHDLDLTILLSGVLERLLRQYCDPEQLETFLRAQKRQTLLSVLLESGAIVGTLRWLSERQTLSLNFQSLSFAVFVDKPSLGVNRSELIRAVIGNTRSCRATPSSVASDMIKLEAGKADARQIANGHDVIELLAIALRFTVARCKPEVAEPRNIEKMCRMAFAASDFQTTRMYRCIKAWEDGNAPYQVLRI